MTITEPCGCENERSDEACGALHCVKKCEFHHTFSLSHPNDSPDYYLSMGCLQNGIPQNKRYIDELYAPLMELDAVEYIVTGAHHRKMLEIGCGLGMYVPLFLAYGWTYFGIDTAEYATYWTRNTFAVEAKTQNFEWCEYEPNGFGLILGAHVFEHLQNTPKALDKCFRALSPGGMLIALVPDDTDKVNPDHYWFFKEDSLRATLEKIGFVNVRATTKKIVEHEAFIYCVAEKPA